MSSELESVGEYTLTGVLLDDPGKGRVLVGRRRGAGDVVALKLLEAKDADLRTAFGERAEFLMRLDHPNVARTLETGALPRGGAPWSATVHVSAVSLARLLEVAGPTLDEGLALRIALATCQGLTHVEERLGFHGDVRPRNLAITPAGGVLILDMGFPSRAGPVVISGSPEYAPPEVLEGRIDVDVRADLYALGVCLYLAATGKNPLASDPPSLELPDPRGANPAISEGFARIVAGLCARNRDERYDSPRKAGQDMVRALRAEVPVGPAGKFAAIALDALVRASRIFADPSPLVAAFDRVPAEPGGPAESAPTFVPNKPTQRFKITRGHYAVVPETPPGPAPVHRPPSGRFELPGSPQPEPPPVVDATPTQPHEVGADWKAKVNFQAAWGHGQGADWRELNYKREYFFKHAVQEEALDRPKENEDPLDEADLKPRKDTSARMLLSEDGSRAYQVVRELGRGGQGVVYLVRVMGNQAFEGFAEPVEEAVVKISKHAEALRREQSVYAHANPGIVKLLDAGKIDERRGYLVLERLYLNPFGLFRSKEKRMSVDVATAVDTFVNLLETLHGLHMRRENPIVLCDIKPDNIMLRMQNKGGTPSLQEYLRRIAAGAYEPVFMDMGCAQDRDSLRATEGKLEQLLGTPVYLAPESTPDVGIDHFKAGVYSPKMDVYALTLTLYEYLTADRPYRALGLYRHTGHEFLRQVLDLKRRHASPIDPELLTNVLGAEAKVVRRILELGTHPDPEKRPNALSLLEECKRVFKVKQNFQKTVSEYRYDEARGLRLMQQRYGHVDPVANRYLDFRRAAGLRTPEATEPSPETLTVDDWLATRDELEAAPSDGDTPEQKSPGPPAWQKM
ncbi:MAG TPA: protein kinase [Planctomycetota bacterium]|nr:protein kinase [Planctomycetota bacterium]